MIFSIFLFVYLPGVLICIILNTIIDKINYTEMEKYKETYTPWAWGKPTIEYNSDGKEIRKYPRIKETFSLCLLSWISAWYQIEDIFYLYKIIK